MLLKLSSPMAFEANNLIEVVVTIKLDAETDVLTFDTVLNNITEQSITLDCFFAHEVQWIVRHVASYRDPKLSNFVQNEMNRLFYSFFKAYK